MSEFDIDTSYVVKPTRDGEINEYISREAQQTSYFTLSRKVIFVNGMQNSGKDHAESAITLSLVQMCPVIGVYNKTDGFVADLWQCLTDKNQFQGLSKSAQSKVDSRNSFWSLILHGARTSEQAAVDALSRNPAQVPLFHLLRLKVNRHREVFAHSQGNLILSNVLQAIAAVDGPESLRGRVVHTFGSPAVIYPPGIQLYEHGYTFDPVNWLSGFDTSFSISKVGMPTGSKNPITHGFLWYMRDDPRFIINRYRVGGWGMTFNMDEDGLADCLVAMGTNLPRVHKIVDYLDQHHNSDADDVVLLYLQKIKGKTAIVNGLKSSPDLVKLFIKTLDEGWTSSEESAEISWLRSLA